MSKYIKIIFVFFALFFISCSNENTNQIDTQILKLIFIDTINVNNVSNNSNFYSDFVNDTIYENNKNSYKNAMKKLLKIYSLIDKLNTNFYTKQYVKSTLLAEWIYGSFNIQFLGPVLGLADTTNFDIDFKNSDIKKCYLLGNTNQVSVRCSDRTKLFIRLADTLLHLKAKKINFKNIHSFPIVEIGNLYYIVDPYDPFILFSENYQTVVDYNTFKINFRNIITKAIRTKRIFGNSGELISNKFYKLLKNKYEKKGEDVGKMIYKYFKQNKLELSEFIDSCTFEHFYTNTKVFPVVSLTNSFAIYKDKNTIPNQVKNSRINKYYLGVDCKQ